jgi:hypothetical protein
MGEREPRLPLSPDTGLLTGPSRDAGDVTLTQHLISGEELQLMNAAAEAIRLDLQTPSVLPPFQELFTGEPPHPAGPAAPPLPGSSG